ncbi:hypothetical protein ACPPVW_01700 [Leifsonia sp. McL0607]|uniref:hypothetical protein n=1 Tax=Leifsonia sp. McL0607 TaxID=3415672 RepID=UPI003CEFF27D
MRRREHLAHGAAAVAGEREQQVLGLDERAIAAWASVTEAITTGRTALESGWPGELNGRPNPPYLDKPVVGTGLLRDLDSRRRGRGRARRAVGRHVLELFALAGRSNSRQDIDGLRRAPLAARCAGCEERLGRAEAAVAALGRDAAAVRGQALLGDVQP